MKVFTVERDCIDPYFEAHTVAIFSTEEKAQAFIKTQSDPNWLNICEWDLDESTEQIMEHEDKK